MKKYVCIDVGGTSIKHGVICENGEIIVRGQRDTEAYKGGLIILEKMKDIVKGYKINYKIEGICISTAGMVDPVIGKIIYSSDTIPNYIGLEIKKELEKEFEIRCEVENDVNCAGLGECWIGVAKDVYSSFCMTVGTGIGGCIIIDNKVLPGFSNSAGEIGYMNMNGSTFQKEASTSSLVKSVAIKKGIDTKDINGKNIFDLAKQGDVDCIESINELVEVIALGISNIVYIINPEMIVLGGGIMAQKQYLKEKIDTALKGKLIDKLYKETKIEFAQNENHAGMLGALYNFLYNRK